MQHFVTGYRRRGFRPAQLFPVTRSTTPTRTRAKAVPSASPLAYPPHLSYVYVAEYSRDQVPHDTLRGMSGVDWSNGTMISIRVPGGVGWGVYQIGADDIDRGGWEAMRKQLPIS